MTGQDSPNNARASFTTTTAFKEFLTLLLQTLGLAGEAVSLIRVERAIRVLKFAINVLDPPPEPSQLADLRL